jgi:hypothetical protein
MFAEMSECVLHTVTLTEADLCEESLSVVVMQAVRRRRAVVAPRPESCLWCGGRLPESPGVQQTRPRLYCCTAHQWLAAKRRRRARHNLTRHLREHPAQV